MPWIWRRLARRSGWESLPLWDPYALNQHHTSFQLHSTPSTTNALESSHPDNYNRRDASKSEFHKEMKTIPGQRCNFQEHQFQVFMKKLDHIILGTGQATGTLLAKLIPTNNSIAVIEGQKIGGSCVNYGCTPTKTMVASARAIHLARRGAFYGFDAGPIKVNYDRIRNRMNEIRNGSSNGLANWMESTSNVELIRGWGAFEGPKIIRVGEQLMEGKHIYINVGTKPFIPPIVGIHDVPWMDSARLLDLDELPKHLIIIGGGYIGVEFAQVYRRFGAQVTIVQRGKQLMPREDEDVANAIQSFLADEGIEIICNANASSVMHHNGKIELAITLEGKEKHLSGSHLLLAVGRRPNSDTLELACY